MPGGYQQTKEDMGVDLSTWRVRVGMFSWRTSQKELLVFRAQPCRKSPSHYRAPGSINKNTIPDPPKSFRVTGSIQQDINMPYSKHPAQKAYSHVAGIKFRYVFHLLLLLCVSLVDSPSDLRPPSACQPVLLNPDQNETSPVQMSCDLLLNLLMCGDVEVNPGPPKKLTSTERAKELSKFSVPVEDINYPEYCYTIDVDFTLKKFKPGYLEQMEDIACTVCAMLNHAGGVVTLKPKTRNTDKELDDWVNKIQQRLHKFVEQEVSRCIEIKIESGQIEMWICKSWKFITLKLSLYVRKDATTVDGDITLISGAETQPAFVSRVEGIQWNQLNHGDQFPLSEGKHLEFKCYTSTCDAATLMEKITTDKLKSLYTGEPPLIKTLLAFTNTEGGGDVIIGIREVNGAPILEGQKLTVADEREVQRRFDELMIRGLDGEQRVWPSAPNGSEWTIKFYPLRNCPGSNRRVLIHIRVNQIAGGVLADEPEAYMMTCEGDIRHLPHEEWKKCIRSTYNQSAKVSLMQGVQSAGQDEDDNYEEYIDDEQFEQLVTDLKLHRGGLSLKHIKSASWVRDSDDSQDDIMPGVNMDNCVKEVSKSELLMPSCPTTWVPDRAILDKWMTNNHHNMEECVNEIAQSHSQDAVVLGTTFLGSLFPGLSLKVPQYHIFDFFVLKDNRNIDLWMVFEDCRDIVTCKKYANSAIRILRSQLLSYIHQHTDTKVVTLAIRAKVWSTAENSIKYETAGGYPESTIELPVLQKVLARGLLQGQSHIRNRLGEQYLTALTKDQLSGLLHYPYVNVIVFKGPPGSGKSIIAQHLCDREAQSRNIGKDKILYICPCRPLAEFIKFQQRCEVKFTKSKKLVHTIREALRRGILLIIVDDAHLFQCSKREWTDLLKLFKGSDERHFALFLDPEYQNFQGGETKNLFNAISDFNTDYPFFPVHIRDALPIMIRNSQSIFTFFKENAEEGSSALTCLHDFRGYGVSVNYVSEDFFLRDTSNPVIKITKDIVGHYNFEESFTYQETDITILVDSDGRKKTKHAIEKLLKIFQQFYPEAMIQRASQFPVQGIVIEELRSFSGLDTRVCILVLTCKNTSVMSDPRYKCFVASRGITKLVFLLDVDTVDNSFKQLKFSEEKQWQKSTRQLLKEIPEKGSSEEWLRTNVPDTECWQNTKPMVMQRCIQTIPFWDNELVDWIDRHIPPAWRQDAQFVRAVIKAVCERTIYSERIDSEKLRQYLGAMNCLYRAPEALQIQALNSVDDHVRTLQHPENVLREVLSIMLYDGYICRQVIQSRFVNMDLTSAIKHQGILTGGEKDLGELLQERMGARQEVKRWMQSQMRPYNEWYDSPHYQRVALHALCQLAVTWQADKCTVNKGLLLQYIRQLYCETRVGLQLLYAVQCVLHHLKNPPGLAMAVIHDVFTPYRRDEKDEPIITTSDWDKWRKTQNPAYEEGRDTIQKLGQFIDLIILVSRQVTPTTMNRWISENILQEQVLDAFIIIVECLINRGEEVTLIENWISQNVPEPVKTVVQDTLKHIIVQKCVERIQFSGYNGLADWVDRHILQAWRQDAQFVRTVIKAICERTIYSDKIDFEQLRQYVGALNCFYGAPEALQHQALHSVYDHVRNLQDPENVLQEVLVILWHDRYISRQAMLSWFGNMDQTHAIMFQGMQGVLAGGRKDLGELLLERMRARLEVREWMQSQVIPYPEWYDSPHYQRVALHVLCQLAITGQGDSGTVNKDLLFHYVPQLFCDTKGVLQLLYAVQCVLYHLQNTLGLDKAVFLAVLDLHRPDIEDTPLITTTDWYIWINTQNPVYDEGRNIIQQQGHFLDLIILASSDVTLTEMNGWISGNIPQEQLLDAFIIAAVCLINRVEEVALIKNWISQNVPIWNAVQDTLKLIIIQRCVGRIQFRGNPGLADWVDRHILPAWRQDVQFVRAVIKAVCERTIHSDNVDSKELMSCLGAINCLYGAPEALQIQALHSVYYHFRTLQHPENVLQQVLDIMWYDGYISRQVMLSWFSNMDQTSVIKFQEILEDSKKDLGELLEERMRSRLEVTGWMDSQMRSYNEWYDSPHYQRVAGHALCQMAVTWQGDKCAVYRGLLFHYIPQLFCHTNDGLQLLYAVQCVVNHLHNPPGLAMAVMQAAFTLFWPGIKGKYIITSTDLAKWRNTQNPVYEEGRNIIQQQDQVRDAFIIAARCLINRREVRGNRNWISQNIPQSIGSVVQDILKCIMIERCAESIQSRGSHRLAEWVDRHILPAWRRGAQFVRNVLTSVCERTIQSDELDSEELMSCLGALNCLYGAPKALQIQALHSVYNHVITLQHPENILLEILDIMWYDGYIGRQAIQSWLGNMDQTSAIKLQEILAGSEKDLGEQLQERMGGRQEVKRWMQSQLTPYNKWYDSPHYQRVALHALCHLAVTWQGDTCTVDRDLLFHYVPQLYCFVSEKLQLLYAVQCVLHHLHNPKGLAMAVIQAVLSLPRPDTEDQALMRTTEWDQWINPQSPVYAEGRDIIQEQGHLLYLITLASSKVTMTEMNDWICGNIPQEQMLDAFTIAAVCLINQGEEMTQINKWISQNVPQPIWNEVQGILKCIIIQRWIGRIQFSSHNRLADWVDRHILPAWRQDAQFVRAAMKAVCERTIHSDKIDSAELKNCLGALNCLYGAPEPLQIQALESVYDHVITLQHPENVLQEILDIMWYDGYIGRPALQSWFDNMDQTSLIENVELGDLGEKIQDRMRASLEVKRWMAYELWSYPEWYDSPHYQRVALHALFQLALIWHGDSCTVDKDLLFDYIPQLFCETRNGLQLLYAVQCVVYHLQNPPGLAMAVLQAVCTLQRPDIKFKVDPRLLASLYLCENIGNKTHMIPSGFKAEPIITTTDWDQWRNTQNPVYDEGRNIIQQQAHLLYLILASSDLTLTEINGWISGNIPQEQVLDAFIIAAVCLINQGEEVTLINKWISQNVPQLIWTAVQGILKPMIIQRCIWRIKFEGYTGLADWVDRYILPAWRQDTQFVRDVIKAVCQRTVHSDRIYSQNLRQYLGVLNCLYGAPEVLQIHALHSIYNHVITLQHHEKALQEILYIMWYDGYIGRQAIQSWFDNMDQLQEILPGGKKDLGELLQERMRARQEVRRWMQSQMRPYNMYNEWYESPHYQRVALHALCQLAVTWQGDTCRVDDDLLFHYIPQLFCLVNEKLQLIYATICVLHQLNNPPGLKEAVLQALLSPPSVRPILMQSDLEELSEKEYHPYE